jgi:hypothetical protein
MNSKKENTFSQMNKIEPPVHGGLMDIVDPAIKLGSNVLIKGINMASESLGVDKNAKLENPFSNLNMDLDFSNPEVKKNFEKTARNIGEASAIIVESAAPAIKSAVNKSIDILASSGEKIAQSSIKAGLDVAGTIPGIGELIEGVRVIDDVVKAGEAGADAVAQFTTTGMDTLTQTYKNYQDLLQQKNTIANRIDNTKKDFENTNMNKNFVNPKSLQTIQQSAQIIPQKKSNATFQSGGIKHTRKYRQKIRYLLKSKKMSKKKNRTKRRNKN